MTDRETKLRNLLIEVGIFIPREKNAVTIVEYKGDLHRQSGKRSSRYFVSKDNIPLYAVKYLPPTWNFPTATIIETMKRYRKLDSIKVPGHVATLDEGDGVYIVEEYLRDAVSLESLVSSGSVGTSQAAELLRQIFTEVYQLGEKPKAEFFAEERGSYLKAMRAYIREGAFGDTMLAYVEKVINEHASECRMILSTGDIIDRNILYAHGAWHLVDFEYSHETIFGFKEAYRNILYTNWARYFSLADLYPPLGGFPMDVAAMLSLAWEYRFQEKILDEESLKPTLRHLRYLFWNAVEPTILYKLDRHVGEVEALATTREEEVQRARREVAETAGKVTDAEQRLQNLESLVRQKDEELSTLHGHVKHQEYVIVESDKKTAHLEKERQALQGDIQQLQIKLAEQQKQSASLDAQVQILNSKREALQQQIGVKEQELSQQSKTLAQLQESFSKLQLQLGNKERQLDEQLQSLSQHKESIAKLHLDISNKDQDIQQKLKSIAEQKELNVKLQHTSLEKDETIRAKEERANQVEAWGNSLQKQLQYKNATVILQEGTIDDLSRRVNDLEARVAEKEFLYRQKVADYIFIKSTLSYSLGKILTLPFSLLFDGGMKIFGVIDKAVGATLWPKGTRRHLVVDSIVNIRQTIATATYLLRIHGISGLWNGMTQKWDGGINHVLHTWNGVNLVSHKTLQAQSAPIPMKTEFKPLQDKEHVTLIDAGVSVVIPVLNEADNLTKLLPVLRNQKGVRAIEIIVVDSGSSDDSIALAEENSAKVIRIPPEKFSHSGSRNLGAQHATQEYLLFMTADALPVSERWLNQMFSFMKKEGVDAVSCMESPRIDADLFPQVENWYHYRVILGLNGQDRVSMKPENNDPVALRMNAQLSDVACLMKRTTFQKYTFRYDYAEDLDLGIRLLNDGGKIGLMSSTRVIHSHTRPAYYYMKRGYIDKMTLSKMLNERLEDTHVEFATFSQDIFFSYDALSKIHFSSMKGMQTPVPVEEFIQDFQQRFQPLMAGDYPARVHITDAGLDKQTVLFLRHFYTSYFKEHSKTRYNGILMDGIRVFANNAFDYLRLTHDLIDSTGIKDFEQLIYKYYANLAGRYLGVCYLKTPADQQKRLQSIHAELFDGKILWDSKTKDKKK